MPITKLRTKQPRANKRRPTTPRRDTEAEVLTIGALYDIAQHGATATSTTLHGQTGPTGLRALLASALNVQTRNAQDIRRLIQPWQARAMSYYDLVPEVKFGAQFMSQMLRKVRLFPALLDPDTHEPEEIHDGPIFNAFQRIQDRGGGRTELQASYAKQKYLIGETYLTVSPDEERGEIWECLSPNELRVQPGGVATRFRAPMLPGDSYIIGNDPASGGAGPEFRDSGPDIINVYRLWRPHPAYTWLADCAMQAAIDLLEELVLSTYSVRAQLKSRLNQAGILWVPDEISFTSLGNNPEEDPDSDQFQERLTQTIMAGISDPGSAAAYSPIIARIAGDWIGKVQYTRFNDNVGELAEINQRAEMVERFAVGQELPPEIFRSKEDISHWGSWLVDEDQWKSYGLNASLEMAGDLNAAYLQPTAREEGFAEWERVCIGIDPAEVINHPDRSKDADALYGGLAISKSVWRESKGYNDNDAMPDDERAEQIGIKTRDSSLAWDGVPSVRGGTLETAPGVIESTAGTESEPVADTSTGSDVERGAPPGGPYQSAEGPALVASASDEREQRILGAAEFAVQRGRELAGSRLRAWTSERGPKDKRCADCQDAIDGVANWDVACTLGEKQVAALKAEGGLVAGTGAAFAAVLERMSVTPEWAAEIGALVEAHAAKTLYQPLPDPLPAGFALLLRRLDLPLERT